MNESSTNISQYDKNDYYCPGTCDREYGVLEGCHIYSPPIRERYSYGKPGIAIQHSGHFDDGLIASIVSAGRLITQTHIDVLLGSNAEEMMNAAQRVVAIEDLEKLLVDAKRTVARRIHDGS